MLGDGHSAAFNGSAVDDESFRALHIGHVVCIRPDCAPDPKDRRQITRTMKSRSRTPATKGHMIQVPAQSYGLRFIPTEKYRSPYSIKSHSL